MEHIVKNRWTQVNGRPYAESQILRHQNCPEGLDVSRIRYTSKGDEIPDPAVGHLVSIIEGSGQLVQVGGPHRTLYLEPGTHLFLPPNQEHRLAVEAGTELVKVSASSAPQARGKKLLLRNELFLSASAQDRQTFRWILTPQYLSRRIFLHHDNTLLSKSGNPVSWFRTTMFDVSGLPVNDEGDPVFKMSYNSRTEFNVCYNVQGTARVRVARHPYREKNQEWEPWQTLDNDTTYLLNESENGEDVERNVNASGEIQTFRNKHEVYILDGQVTLFCMFDPAPAGVERHLPGAYSDYEPLKNLIGTDLYKAYQQEIVKYDLMVDTLSMAKAEKILDDYKNTEAWELYLQGRQAQDAIEAELMKQLREENRGRDRVVAPWTSNTNISY